MSRKHFEAIAAVLRSEYDSASESDKLALRRVIIGLAGTFAEANPRFDKDRFYEASGMR